MKTLKLTALLLLSILIVSTTGCVSITSSPDVEDSFYDDPNPVTTDSEYFQAIEVGKTEGFKGTNPFWFSGKVSPNLDNNTAKEALEDTLRSAKMLAVNGSATYQLDAIMVDDDAKGVFGGDNIFTGTERNMSIRYVLRALNTTAILYNEVIKSHGEAGCSDLCIGAYLQESIATERSNTDSHKQLIEDLKGLQAD